MSIVGYLVLFAGLGVAFLMLPLLIGKFLRPHAPNPEKQAVYECGEPTIGSSWIQFDLRFYVVALLFIIFDVEVAFFFPWAVAFGKANRMTDAAAEVASGGPLAVSQAEVFNEFGVAPGELAAQAATLEGHAAQLGVMAFVDILVFFGVLLVGFAYVWRRGDIDWIRAVRHEPAAPEPARAPVHEPAGVAALSEPTVP